MKYTIEHYRSMAQALVRGYLLVSTIQYDVERGDTELTSIPDEQWLMMAQSSLLDGYSGDKVVLLKEMAHEYAERVYG